MIDIVTEIEQTGPGSWKVFASRSATRCSSCREEVVWVTGTIADIIVAIDGDGMMPSFHTRETDDGITVFCLNSLSFVA